MTTLEKTREKIIELFKSNGACNTRLCFAVLQLFDKYAEQEPKSPCDLCVFNPPSSANGKPCCMCPAGMAEKRSKE